MELILLCRIFNFTIVSGIKVCTSSASNRSVFKSLGFVISESKNDFAKLPQNQKYKNFIELDYPTPVELYARLVHLPISYPEPAIFRRRIESSGIIHNRKPEILAFFARLLHSFLYQQPIRFTQIHGLSQSSRFFP